LNTASIAMSFASAKLTFNSCNSRSIPSNVRLDKSISRVFDGLHYTLANSGRMWAHYAPNAKGLVETRLSGGLYIISPEMVAGVGFRPPRLTGNILLPALRAHFVRPRSLVAIWSPLRLLLPPLPMLRIGAPAAEPTSS
jgi:hypothetical protein